MKNYLYNDWMRIALPEEWELENDHEAVLLTMYNSEAEDGRGVLQISFIRRNREDHDLHQDLIEQLHSDLSKTKEPIIIVPPVVEENNNYLVGRTEYIVDNRYWRIWHLFSEKKGLFITYNSDEEDKDKEIEEVDKIIDSITFVGDPYIGE